MLMLGIKVIPGDEPVGAQITGVDLVAAIDDATFAQIDAALSEHAVIFARQQKITPAHQVAFSCRFGELEINAFNNCALLEEPRVLVVSNIKENGTDTGYADVGSHWHTDMSYTATPPRLTMLYPVEVPYRDGIPLGDAWFASASAANDDLSEDLKARLAGKRAIDRFAAKERGVNKPVPITAQQIAKNLDVIHPIVRNHQANGW
jgi:taurine dioxygenase